MLQEARETAELIVKEAQDSSLSILEGQKQLGIKEANAHGSLLLKKAANEAEIERLRRLTTAKITANWIVLSKKEQIITSVLNEARKTLQDMIKTPKYVEILENLIIKAGILLADNELTIVLSEQDSKLPLDLDRLAKEIGSKTKSKLKIKLSNERISVIGGAIVRTQNGKVLMDATFDDIIQQQEKALKTKISEILFE